MKLIVQIPCFNEEHTLPQTIADLPKHIAGVDEIEILIVDDGSDDRTVEVARELGADHIIRHTKNRGLAQSFRTGLREALELGADIIVNTDGDNQYCGEDIPALIRPILAGEADIVIGDRQTASISHFSRFKKFLQFFGSFAVGRLAGLDLPDAVSGFRAFSREAAISTNVVSAFSYTIETAIQAGKKGMLVTSIPIRTNAKTRESRLFKNTFSFILNSLKIVIRVYMMYKPMRVFFAIGTILSVAGLLPIIRFIYLFYAGSGDGHIQSLVVGGTLLLMGFLSYLVGLVADLISFNRQLLETLLELARRSSLDKK